MQQRWRLRSRTVLPLAVLAVMLVTACGSLGQAETVVDLRFSNTARNPAALEALTDQIVLRIYGEGMTSPLERRLEPEGQLVSFVLPAGYKDLVATAWHGERLLAEGQAGLNVSPGRSQEVIINLQPVVDPPAGLNTILRSPEQR